MDSLQLGATATGSTGIIVIACKFFLRELTFAVVRGVQEMTLIRERLDSIEEKLSNLPRAMTVSAVRRGIELESETHV